LDDPIRRELSDLLSELRKLNAPVKWVGPQNLHLTLKFLGEVKDDKVPQAISIIRSCAAETPAFDLTVRGAGAFPNLHRPRVLFVDAEDQPAVAADLAARLNDRMAEIGVEREDRPFQNHITLGRLRNPRPVPEVAQRIEALAGRSFGTMRVDRVTLMKSDLQPAGPVYTAVERIGLK
jgi:2'-5' RNA ligase